MRVRNIFCTFVQQWEPLGTQPTQHGRPAATPSLVLRTVCSHGSPPGQPFAWRLALVFSERERAIVLRCDPHRPSQPHYLCQKLNESERIGIRERWKFQIPTASPDYQTPQGPLPLPEVYADLCPLGARLLHASSMLTPRPHATHCAYVV